MTFVLQHFSLSFLLAIGYFFLIDGTLFASLNEMQLCSGLVILQVCVSAKSKV